MSSEDEHKAKKIRTNDEEVVVESVEDTVPPASKTDSVENENTSESTDPTCLLCMEEGTSLNPLLADHQCPQCSPGAWSVCHVCNEALLSRLCPVCRAEYAPIVMYIMPGESIVMLFLLN